jgi:hypothetical protein
MSPMSTLIYYRNGVPQPTFRAIRAIETSSALCVRNYCMQTIRRRIKRRARGRRYPSQWPLNANISRSRRRGARADANGAEVILRVANAKGPQSVNLGRIWSTASAQPFCTDPAPITSAASALFGYALKDPAGNDIITQLESITR